MNSLKNKLTVSYVLIALFIIIVVSILFNIVVDKIFMRYAIDKQEKQIEQIITQVDQLYIKEDGQYSQRSLEIIGNAALQNGLILHIKDLNGEVDWDIRQHSFGQCQIVLQHAENNMHSLYPNFKGEYSERKFEINRNNESVGVINVGFYGPYSFNDEELYLIKTINYSLVVIAVAALVLALGLGTYMARRLTIPISDVIKTAKEITKGKFGTQVISNSKTKEITGLVTSINELSNELKKMELFKRRLTSDVAHELRTPLSNLLTNTEAMIDGIWIPDKNRLQGFYDEIERTAKIVDDLQKLATIEEKQIVLQKEWFSAIDFLRSLYTVFQIDMDKKQIKMEFDCENKNIYADKDRLKQIMINLVSNAVKYTPKKGIIKIKIFFQEDNYNIYICDNGCGISTQDLPHVFERFYKVDKSRTRSTGGAGIGLAIVKALVLAHSGNITVTSKIEKGTTFKIVLPLKNNL
ncbi:MAG: sensor histidine kinase [Firmicutes bacterium HGW-Firmicutes-5]|nr:MAG: sensor histidine kinase [Firmicutes bacterium HGW-Firmicutes-5]